jgi:GxxExxY protein
MHEKTKNKLNINDLIYPEETYEIIGMMYDVWNGIGFGHKENFYQKAIAEIFRKNAKEFKEQLRLRVCYKEKELGMYILDFLYEGKIVIEIKQGENFSKRDINQIYYYLKATKLKLGLLIHFIRKGIEFAHSYVFVISRDRHEFFSNIHNLGTGDHQILARSHSDRDDFDSAAHVFGDFRDGFAVSSGLEQPRY